MKVRDGNLYAVKEFGKNFENFRTVPVALYGIGENTRLILENYPEFNIPCLLDELTIGQSIYGKPVYPITRIKLLGIQTIIIIARSQSTRIIYARISEFCLANGIEVYDVNKVLLSKLQEQVSEKNLAAFIDGLYSYENSKVVVEPFLSRINSGLVNDRTGMIQVNRNYDIAYLFIAPLAYGYFSWIVEKAKQLELEEVLLSARDGYLFNTIYIALKEKYDLPKMRYFYISRVAVLFASLFHEEDIILASKIPFYESPKKMLKYRFRLNDDEIKSHGKETDQEYILRHKRLILEKSQAARKYYMQYLCQLGINQNAKLGFADFVSSGTCQNNLSKLVEWDLYGLYVMQSDKNTYENIKIESMFGMANAYKSDLILSSRYCEIENIFASPEPTLWGFADNGKPIFDKEYRSNIEIARMKEMQEAVLDYITHSNIAMDEIKQVEVKLFDKLYELFDEKYCDVQVQHFAAGDVACELTGRFNKCFVREGDE